MNESPIDIRQDHLKIVRNILNKHLPPDVKVWVYGSRAKWTTEDSSDLDLALEGNEKIDLNIMSKLKDEFEKSSLPYKVDVLDIAAISEDFKKIIKKECIAFKLGKTSSIITNQGIKIGKKWKEVPLKDVLNFSNGKTSPERNNNMPYPVYGSNGIIGFSEKFNSIEDTIIIGRVGSYCGSLYFSKKKCWVTDNAIKAQGLSKNDSHFLFYLLSSLSLNNRSSGSGQPLLNQSILKSIEAIIPNHEVQKKIAEILSTIDNKIQQSISINRILEDVAQTIFKSWFVDFDPVHAKKMALEKGLSKEQAKRAAMAIISGVCSPKDFAENFKEMDKRLTQKLSKMSKKQQQELAHTVSLFPSEFQDSELGEIPMGWNIENLDTNIDFLNGLALQKFPPKKDGSDLPILKIAQLKKGVAEGGGFASNSIPSKYKITNGDLIFSWSASLMVRIWCGGIAALNQHLFKVSSNLYPLWFQWQWCSHHLEQFQSIAKSKVTTMGHIQRKHLAEAKIIIPDKRSFISFNNLLEPLAEKIISVNLESEKLERLRDILLPKLLAGEINLSNKEL